MKKKLIEMRNKSTIIVEECNIPLSVIDRISGENITKTKEDLNSTMNNLDSYGSLHP